MLAFLKNATLLAGRASGLFRVVSGSAWRQQRLLILCYHGLSTKDEHKWRPLFVTPEFFRKRLETLARKNYRVLALGEAVSRLREGTLPPRSVAITFDDGFQDFSRFALPSLREFGFPATVYQTTYYSDYPYPIFNLILSYLFWRGAGKQLDGTPYGVRQVLNLTADGQSDRFVPAFQAAADEQGLSASERNDIAARIAADLGVDFDEILRLRTLQLMTVEEVAGIAAAGVDVQLHTHRHRTPLDEKLFVREIRDNRQWLATRAGVDANHFCYPSGVYRPEFLPWLRQEGVLSATTCDYGLAERTTEPLLLPRLLDSTAITEVDFESWLAGVSSLLPHRAG